MEQGPTSARAAPLQWGGARGEGRGPSRPEGGGAWNCVHPDPSHREHTLMGVRGELGSRLSVPGGSVEGANAGSFRGVLVVRASARISLGGGRRPPAQPGPWSSWGRRCWARPGQLSQAGRTWCGGSREDSPTRSAPLTSLSFPDAFRALPLSPLLPARGSDHEATGILLRADPSEGARSPPSGPAQASPRSWDPLVHCRLRFTHFSLEIAPRAGGVQAPNSKPVAA